MKRPGLVQTLRLPARALFAQIRNSLNSLTTWFWLSNTAVMTTMAIVVGLGGGLGTVLFRKAVEAATNLALGASEALQFGGASLLLLPAMGGLLVGLWMFWLGSQGPGQGVAGIMEAVALHGGRIAARGAVGRVLGAVITIGSGGSAGPEDPSVQIGATLGSLVSQYFRLSESRIKTLVGCGAAAGLSAAFNAPIAGVFFAIEIILGEFSSAAIGFVVMSAVAGAVVSQSLLGSAPAFHVPPYQLGSPIELLLYGFLGICAAVVAALYINSLRWIETLAEHPSPLRPWIKPALGGLGVGLLGFFIRPEIYGIGYSAIEAAFQHASLDWKIYLALVVLKLMATTITLGSGGQGGLFAPSLFLGGMLGVGFGLGLNELFPTLGIPPAAYGLVGMSAVLAGAVRAPITAIVLPFEMTNDYHIIVPLMTAGTLSFLISQRLQPDSVYTQKHRKKGIDLRPRNEDNLMRQILVREAMTPATQMLVVPVSMPIKDLATRFSRTGRHAFPVVDGNDGLCGIVALQDLERAAGKGEVEGRVGDICTRQVITAFEDESLEEALAHLDLQEVAQIPVVDRRNPRKLLGVLRRSDIIGAYIHALRERATGGRRRERIRLEGLTGSQFLEIDLLESDAATGKKLKEITLPADTVLVSIRRGGRIIIPRGNTILLAHDHVLAAAMPERVSELIQVLKK